MSEELKRIRRKTGNFLEDFEPGQHFRHKGGKTITEGLFTTFTEYDMTTNPLSKNARYARALGFRDLVCPPGLVMLVAFSQTVEDISENARANLEYIDMRNHSDIDAGFGTKLTEFLTRFTFAPAVPGITAVDTTGAGDYWAAGFLSGWLRGMDLETCAARGARLGAEIVQVVGAELPESTWEAVLGDIM